MSGAQSWFFPTVLDVYRERQRGAADDWNDGPFVLTKITEKGRVAIYEPRQHQLMPYVVGKD